MFIAVVSTPRIRQYDRSASAVAGARQYAAEVTDRAQRALHGGRQYAADIAESSHHAWNGRQSYAAVTSAAGRHDRASDPVGWSLLNSASADAPSTLSAWENLSLDVYRRQRRQLRMTSPLWNGADVGPDQAESPPPSWQTQSLHGMQPSNGIPRSESTSSSLLPFPRRRLAAESSQPASSGVRSSLAGAGFQETSSLADVELWPSRRDRDSTSFTPIFVDDIENDAEEITSTGAEAGSTASIGGDTESIDADADIRSSDFELGSVGAEVLVSSSSGSGAEIGVVDQPARAHYDTYDYGPSAGDLSSLRTGSGMSRISERLAELVDIRDRASQRRWRRFNQADLPDRASRHSSSAAASNSSLRISDWLEFDWSGDIVPRRLPQRPIFLDFTDWSDRDRDTSAASDVPRPRNYVAMRSRRGRPPYSGSGAASNYALDHPHECPPNCEICNNGGLGRLPQPSHWLAGSHRTAETSSRTRPFSSSYEMLAPAASAIEDDDSITSSLAALRQEMDLSHDSIPSFPPSIDPARYPAASEFERRLRRLDDHMRRRPGMMGEREPRSSPSLAYRLRERQDALRSQLDALRSHYRHDDGLSSHRTGDDSFPAPPASSSSSVSGYGSTGAEAVSEFINMGQRNSAVSFSPLIWSDEHPLHNVRENLLMSRNLTAVRKYQGYFCWEGSINRFLFARVWWIIAFLVLSVKNFAAY